MVTSRERHRITPSLRQVLLLSLQINWYSLKIAGLERPAAGQQLGMDANSGFVTSPPVRMRVPPPPSWPPTLVVVIDTEEEFDWNAPFDPTSTSVTNIGLQAMAQDIFDRHGVVPTYVVDYPVASTPASAAVLRGFAAEGRCEIGAHLHPWVNPPINDQVQGRYSYPGNLPPSLQRQKLQVLTETIAAVFGSKPRVYKAGRYGIGTATPSILHKLSYTVDASVVPHTDFSEDGGPDFRDAPADPFMIDAQILELPLSVHFVGRLAKYGPRLFPHISGGTARRLHMIGCLSRLGLLSRLRLTPEGHSLADLVRQTRSAFAAGTRLFMLTYHSSALLPGATQYVRTAADQRAFLATLDRYLRFFVAELGGRPDTVAKVAAALRP